MLKSIEVQKEAGLALNSPICIYDLCDRLNVTVRFVDISMEGTYYKGENPRILLSALRPLPRRNFTCAHELGHHVFGHGSTIDDLIEDSEKPKALGLHPYRGNRVVEIALARFRGDAMEKIFVSLLNTGCSNALLVGSITFDV